MLHAHFTTNKGSFTIRLFEEETPNTVANFVGLAEGTKEWTDPKSGRKVKGPFYNGLVFHRVIDGFMIQGGDPLGSGMGGPGMAEADPSDDQLLAWRVARRGTTRTCLAPTDRPGWRDCDGPQS